MNAFVGLFRNTFRTKQKACPPNYICTFVYIIQIIKNMEYRTLGHSGLKVSGMTLGTMTFGGKDKFAEVGSIGVKEAAKIIGFALDNGINLIDTANIYSDGMSEEIVGEVLDGKRPHDVLISTKARMPVDVGVNNEGFSRLHIIRECEKSLKRLRTDHIDIYYIHQWDGVTPVEELMETLDTLIKQGKIRYAGCSNFAGWQIMKSLMASDKHNYQRFVTQQIHYTLEAREAEYELLPIGVDQGLGALIWSPLAGGLLSGKYSRDVRTQQDGRFAKGWNEPPVHDFDRLWNIVDVLKEIAAERGITVVQTSLAWTLARPGVTSLVAGARKLSQLEDSIKAVDVTLTENEIERLNKASQVSLLYPYWHQSRFTRGRMSKADEVLLGGRGDDNEFE